MPQGSQNGTTTVVRGGLSEGDNAARESEWEDNRG